MVEESLFRYTLPDGETPSEGVIKTIATLEGCDETDLNPPLYAAVDPDALDILFRPGKPGRVTFPFVGYHVQVSGDGSVEIEKHGD